MKRGVAIAIVLFLLALVSALAVSGLYATRRLATSYRDDESGERLAFAAEAALADIVVTWDSSARAVQAIGSVAAFPAAPVSSMAIVDVWITRVSPTVYWLVADASQSERVPMRRRIGLLVRVVAGAPSPVPDRPWTELP